MALAVLLSPAWGQPPGPEGVGVYAPRQEGVPGYAEGRLVLDLLNRAGVPALDGEYPAPTDQHPGIAFVVPQAFTAEAVAKLAEHVAAGGKVVLLGPPGTELAERLGIAYSTPEPAPAGVYAIAVDVGVLRGAPPVLEQHPDRISVVSASEGRAAAAYANPDGSPGDRAAVWVTPSVIAAGWRPTAADGSNLTRFVLACIAELDAPLVRSALEAAFGTFGVVGGFKNIGNLQAFVATQGSEASKRWLESALGAYQKAREALSEDDVPRSLEHSIEAGELLRRAIYSASPSLPEEIRAVFAAPPREGHVEEFVELLQASGVNALFLYAGDASVARFASEVALHAEEGDPFGRTVGAMARLAPEIDVFAWQSCFYAPGLTDEDRIALGEARLTKAGTGEAANYLCPSVEENLAYETALLAELVTNYPVRGVVLDYVRFPSSNHCYCDACKEAFRAFDPAAGASWPPVGGHPVLAYEGFRAHQVTAALERLSAAVRAARPGAVVAVTHFGHVRNARQAVGQDVEAWLAAGCVDMLCPVYYRELIGDVQVKLRSLQTQVRGRALVVPERLPLDATSSLPVDPLALLSELNTIRGARCDGLALYAFEPALTRDLGLALGQGAFSAPAVRAYETPIQVALPPEPYPEVQPNAYEQNQPIRVKVTMPTVASADLQVRALSLDQDAEREVGTLRIEAGVGEADVELPAGRWRLSFSSASGAPDDGGIHRGGPALTVLTTQEAQLAADARVRAGRLDALIYDQGRGARTLGNEIRRGIGGSVEVVYSDRLDPKQLDLADLLVIQDPFDPEVFDEETSLRIREWAAAGGRVLLLHNATGHAGMPDIFLRVATGAAAERSKCQEVRIADPNHPAAAYLNIGPQAQTTNEDHALIQPNTADIALLEDDPPGNTDAVVGVASEYVAGRVVLCGIGFGFAGAEDNTTLTRQESDLLLGLVRWLVEGTPGVEIEPR